MGAVPYANHHEMTLGGSATSGQNNGCLESGPAKHLENGDLASKLVICTKLQTVAAIQLCLLISLFIIQGDIHCLNSMEGPGWCEDKNSPGLLTTLGAIDLKEREKDPLKACMQLQSFNWTQGNARNVERSSRLFVFLRCDSYRLLRRKIAIAMSYCDCEIS